MDEPKQRTTQGVQETTTGKLEHNEEDIHENHHGKVEPSVTRVKMQDEAQGARPRRDNQGGKDL